MSNLTAQFVSLVFSRRYEIRLTIVRGDATTLIDSVTFMPSTAVGPYAYRFRDKLPRERNFRFSICAKVCAVYIYIYAKYQS